MSLLNMPNRAETDNNLSPIFALRGLISVIVVRVFVLDFLKRDIVLCVVSCGCECSVNLIKDYRLDPSRQISSKNKNKLVNK